MTDKIEQIKKILWEYEEPLVTQIAQEIVALFPQDVKLDDVTEFFGRFRLGKLHTIVIDTDILDAQIKKWAGVK